MVARNIQEQPAADTVQRSGQYQQCRRKVLDTGVSGNANL